MKDVVLRTYDDHGAPISKKVNISLFHDNIDKQPNLFQCFFIILRSVHLIR